MITERPANVFDVDFVLEDLSEQHREEHEAVGLKRADIMRHFTDLVEDGTADTLWIDNKPAAVIGVGEQSGVLTTWFVATPRYWSTGIRGIRHARRYLREQVTAGGCLMLEILSGRTETERWLKLIGYKKVSESLGVVRFVLT